MQAWNDFEPLCLHDSTLSFASHALFTLQNGLREKGISICARRCCSICAT